MVTNCGDILTPQIHRAVQYRTQLLFDGLAPDADNDVQDGDVSRTGVVAFCPNEKGGATLKDVGSALAVNEQSPTAIGILSAISMLFRKRNAVKSITMSLELQEALLAELPSRFASKRSQNHRIADRRRSTAACQQLP
jgi:hypothetical protein